MISADALRIMVVDDMAVSRGLLTQALEEIGLWRIESVNSAQEALSHLMKSPVHLVLCDYNMPQMDGLQLLKLLRSNSATRKIAFILVTGSPNDEILDSGRRLGLNNLIKKPFTNTTLRHSIESVVGRIG